MKYILVQIADGSWQIFYNTNVSGDGQLIYAPFNTTIYTDAPTGNAAVAALLALNIPDNNQGGM